MSYKFYKVKRFWSLVTVLFFTLALFCPSTVAFANNNNLKKHNHLKCHKGRLCTLVHTRQGLIEGFEDENNTWSWQGIPYAKPPVGELRWKAPQFPAPWKGIRETKDFCEKCSQFNNDGTLTGNEDCLYLNIWRPATQQRNLPVYVWIHGGGNVIGAGSDDSYYGDKLAMNANMIVVTINFRIGPMGWFAHESLEDGNPLNSSGNYGTLDIIRALKWIKNNINNFGGNPGNVTIAGESAGAINVLSLIISPLAKGLFHKAISQSGPIVENSKENGYASADIAIANIINADPDANPEDYDDPSELQALAEYLRSKSTEDIFNGYTPGAGGALNNYLFNFIDGAVIPSDVATALSSPDSYNQVPTILSTNKEEIKRFLFPLYGSVPDEEYQELALQYTKEMYRIPIDNIATAMTAHKRHPGVYAFQLNYGAYNEDGFNVWPLSAYFPNPSGDYANFAVMLGAAHELDIPFFFNNWWYYGHPYPFSEANRPGFEALSEEMVTYLSFFVRTGKPKSPGGVHWLPWSNKEGGPKRILFDADDTGSIIEMSNE